MKSSLRFLLSFFIVFMVIGSVFAGVTKNNIVKEHIYIDKGMRHHMVVLADDDPLAKPFAGGVYDTISHYTKGGLDEWSEGIQSYATPGGTPDTVVNWYWFAADTAEILEIHASFMTTGTGSWNVWGAHAPDGFYVPNTADSKLLIDVPWTILDADTNAEGGATGNLQVLDLAGQGLSAFVGGGGAYVGEYFDNQGSPKLFMDAGYHPRTDATWRVARMYIQSYAGWYFWANSVDWTEFAQQIVVHYEKVAPVVEGLTVIPDHFAGNPGYPSVSAKVFDLDGTVATADLTFAVGAAGGETRVAMVAGADDMFTGTFGTTFSGGDTVYFWVETTDDEGNFRATTSNSFEVVTPPAVGTDILYVDQGGEVDDAFTGALDGKDVFVWDVAARGGITDYEITYGFDNILWYGFGSAGLPSPFETGAHGIKTFLDGGGNLMVVDADYLYGWGFSTDTLDVGTFGADYLGMYTGWSDIGADDSIHYGVTEDPISGAFDGTTDSLVTMPDTYGVWNADYTSDWMDYVVPGEGAESVFYTPRSMSVGYSTAIRYTGAGFKTAFFPFRVEATDLDQLSTVVDNTLAWFAVVGIDDDKGATPTAYALQQNYPNPFNPTTAINFTIANTEKVQLFVYNMLGQKVATLINGNLNAGPHNVTWNGINEVGQKVATGIYFYELKSGDFSSIKKMLLVK